VLPSTEISWAAVGRCDRRRRYNPADMTILQELCSTPTAPFAEHRVVRYVERFVNGRKNLKLSRDEHGNLLIELRSRAKRGTPRWVFGAHMDHPGFVAARMLEKSTLEARFHGWVKAEFFNGERVRFFTDAGEVRGVVQDFTIGRERGVPQRVRIRVSKPVPAGSPGMWDQGEGRVKGGKFYSRVCDDLAGAAAALTMIDQLSKRPPKAPVAVLLTRAEEEGFIGAIAASLKPKLLRKSDRIIAIETSAVQPYAPQGQGAIIRTGDRTSIFNSGLTYFLQTQAAELGKRDKTFKYQRALMPGGTCEATVYDIYGFTAASICVALGNYHNMDSVKRKIAPEYIDLADSRNMVKLFVQVAKNGHSYEEGHAELKQRVERRFAKLKGFL
jgi:endoglucanase